MPLRICFSVSLDCNSNPAYHGRDAPLQHKDVSAFQNITPVFRFSSLSLFFILICQFSKHLQFNSE